MRKLTTLAMAAAMTVAMAVPAMAGSTFTTDIANTSQGDGGALVIDVKAIAGDKLDKVNSIVVDFTIDDSDGFGGGFMMNSNSTNWKQKDGEWDWCNPDGDKAVPVVGADGKYTLTMDFGAERFAADDEYAQVVVQGWWGADPTITAVTVLADGQPVGDVAPVAYLAAVLAIAGVAVIASKKVRA